ncbi:MAG: patatin-like phospholipase family protein, partial [Candidatus Methylomirabilales bacterium]
MLERLLEDDRLRIEGICGTSAGAMNGAMVAYGMMNGGREGARALLETFWRKISERALFSPLKPTWLDRMLGRGNMDYSPPYLMFDVLSRLYAPYQLNITGLNPLHDVLCEVVDFTRLRQCESPKLFVCATNVRTGKIKVFQPGEVSVDALLASACLPFMFPAVEIDGEHYWDGGFMGNPAIFPLI